MGLMSKAKPAILVTGAPRSGTTFLGKMLALPREVVYVDEPFNHQTGLMSADIPFPYLEAGTMQEKQYSRLLDDLIKGKARYRSSDIKKPTANPAKQIARYVIISKANLIYKSGARAPWSKRYLLKDPMACMASEYMHRNHGMPTVIIIRHPASTIASYKRLGWYFDLQYLTEQPSLRPHLKFLPPKHKLTPIEEWSYFWLNIYERLTTFAQRNPGMILIRHEDLSRHPDSEFKELYQKLKLPYSQPIRQKISSYTSSRNPTDPPNNIAHHLKRNSKNNIKRWKKILTTNEVDQIRSITDVLATKYYTNADWA